MNPKQLMGSLSSADSMIKGVLGLLENIGRQMQGAADPNAMEAQRALAEARQKIDELRSKISEVGTHLSKTASSKGGSNVSKKFGQANGDVKDIAKTLVDVADALDEKGAFEEAAIADGLLQEIPEVFTVEETPASAEPVEAPKAEAPKVETPKVETPAAETPKVETPAAEAPKAEAPKTEGTPFSQLKDEKKEAPKAEEKKEEPKAEEKPKREPVNPEIQGTKEKAPEMDVVSLKDFEDIINSMKLRISQGPKRKVYEQVLERARKADEYRKAYEEWLGYAHKLLDEHKEPIRIKL